MVIAIVALTTSCETSSDDNKFTEKLGMYQMYTVTMGPNTTIYADTLFTYDINYTKSTVDITMTGVKFSPKMPAITMKVKDIPFANTTAGIKINAVNLVPEVDDKPVPEYTISSLNCRIAMSAIKGMNTAMLSFVVNGITVTVYPIPVTFEHNSKTNVSIPAAGNNDFSFNGASYAVTFNQKTRMASIYVFNMKFAEKMPAMNMIFPNIPFTPTASGFQLECAEFIPTLNNAEKTPVNNYPIRDFQASINSGRLNLSFKCNSFNATSEAFMFASEKTN